MEGGSVADIARNAEGGRLDEGRLKRFTRSIVEGLVYLHEREIVHCDIKGRNILIGSSGVKIADFGAARRIREPEQVSGKRLEGKASQNKPDEASEKRHTCDRNAIESRQRSRKTPAKRLRFDQLTVERIASNQEDAAEQPSCAGSSERIPVLKGTPLWMAPEVLQGVEQGLPSDIWSLGCTVVEMAQGSPPWTNALEADASLEQLMFKIACTEEDLPLPPSLSDECQDFLSKCLQRDPHLRWSAPDLLRHPFLVSEDASSSDHLSFRKQPQSSPRSTLDFAVSGRESHDGDDDRCSDELQDDQSWQCGFPSSADEDRSKLRSLNQNSVALHPPPVAMPQDCIWITVRCLDEDVVMNQDEEANTLRCLPFMTQSSAIVVQKGCEVNLDCASFLLKRRVRKVAS
jgi:serine/threonine protein kinase